MDPVLPLSPNGDATAQASPAVAMMRAAAEAKKRALDKQGLANQYKASEEARMQTQGNLANARESRIATQDQNAADTQTMANDLSQWSQNPSQPQYRASWDQTPDEVKTHVATAYPGVSAQAPHIWNNAVTQNTGTQVGVPITAPTTAQILHASSQGVEHTPGESSDDLAAKVSLAAQAKANGVPSDVKSELVRMGKWKNGMTLEDAQQARDQGYMENGMIPEKYQGASTKLMGQIQHNQILAPFAKQKDAFETLKSGFEKPDAGGFADMAMIEGFQRLVNPGATVRQGTMDNMKSAAGWLQQLDPSFQWGKATIGDKLTPEARQRLMQLGQDSFNRSQRLAARELASKRNLARMEGVPPNLIDNFINSVLTYVANEGGEQPQTQATQSGQNLPPAANPATPPARASLQPVRPGSGVAGGQQPFTPPPIVADQRTPIQQVQSQPQSVRMTSPEGQQYMIPAANVEAARARGFK